MALDGEGQIVPVSARSNPSSRSSLVNPTRLRRVALAELVREPDRPYCVLDIETTGTDACVHRLWEAAAVRFECGREVARYEAIANPGVPIPPEVQKLCGVTQEEVDRKGRPPAEVLGELGEFLRGAVVVTHGAGFDAPFVEVERQRARIRNPLITDCACSITAARWYVPDLRSYALEPLAQALRVRLDGAHRADADVGATAGVVRTLLELACRPAADPTQELLSGEVYERVFEWRRRVAAQLHDAPAYFVLTNREIGALGRALVLGWKPTADGIKRQTLEVAGRKAALKAAPLVGGLGLYAVEAWRGAPPAMVRMNPLWCSLCGEPPEGGWPCDHVWRGARKLALSDAHLDDLADSLVGLEPSEEREWLFVPTSGL